MHLRTIQQNEEATPELSTPDCQLVIGMYADFYPKFGFEPPWVGYFVMDDDRVVGSCSFVGPPKDGAVEIAYWTFSEFEGRGVASWACAELVSIARTTDPNLTITAKTAPEKNASTRILEKNGFRFREVVQDHEIGDAWLWVHGDPA